MKVAVQEVVFFFCGSLLLILFPPLQHGCSTGCSPFMGCICVTVGSSKAAVPSGFALGLTWLTNSHPQAAVPSGLVPAPSWALHMLQSLQGLYLLQCRFSTVCSPFRNVSVPLWRTFSGLETVSPAMSTPMSFSISPSFLLCCAVATLS